LGCARAFLRNNEEQYPCGAQVSGKCEKRVESRGVKWFSGGFGSVFKGSSGRNEVFKAAGEDLFWKTTPKKKPFFSFNCRFFFIVFEAVEEERGRKIRGDFRWNAFIWGEFIKTII
jgi:hypothetical protein